MNNLIILISLMVIALSTAFWINNPCYYLIKRANGTVSRTLVIPLPGKIRLELHKQNTEPRNLPGIGKTCMHWDRQVKPHPPSNLKHINHCS